MTRAVVRAGRIQEAEDDDIDVELTTPNAFFSTHVNQIPLQNAVSAPRLFYGARFYNQAVPLINAEASLVQNLVGSTARTFDEDLGERLGAVFSYNRGRVKRVTPDEIEIEDADTGETKVSELYNNFVFNRKTGIHNMPLVKEGDEVSPGQILARSNYTDGRGRVALGLNARVGLVPYKGYSMDDAVVISQSFANRLTSQQTYAEDVELDSHTKSGLGHFTSVFPTDYTKNQLESIDENGVAKIGTVLQNGDPYMLLTRPRMFTSNEGAMGKLSRAMRTSRQNASMTWEHEEPARVIDAVKTKKGYKVVLQSETPTKLGDKIVERHGQKGIVSLILPDEHMPRTVDGEPLEILLNPLGMPSRVNNATIYDMLLGKVAKKTGKEYRLPGFNMPGEKWYDFVQRELEANGLSDKEEIFDPKDQRKLENPVTVGNAYFLKLHHMGEDKVSARGQSAYDVDLQPLKGGSDAAQAKRLSTLELNALLSSGAYATMREGATIRGTKNDDYWRALRQGHTPKEPGSPFVWDKFKALMVGSGMLAKDVGGGNLRLGPFTDDALDKLSPGELQNGGMVDPNTLEPEPGGLFDPALVGSGKWARIRLPEPVPNPAFEKQIALLLGIREKDVEAVVAGDISLEEARGR